MFGLAHHPANNAPASQGKSKTMGDEGDEKPCRLANATLARGPPFELPIQRRHAPGSVPQHHSRYLSSSLPTPILCRRLIYCGG